MKYIAFTCLLILPGLSPGSVLTPAEEGKLIYVYAGGWGGFGKGDGQFEQPRGIEIGPGDIVYVADTFNSRVQYFTPEGSFLGKWGSVGEAVGEFRTVNGLAVGPAGDVYVPDRGNDRIQHFSAKGVFKGAWGSTGTFAGQFDSPLSLDVGTNGDVYVIDSGNQRVQRFTAEGSFVEMWGGEGTGPGQFIDPLDVAVGPDGKVYVADTGNYRIQYFTAEGDYLGEWGREWEPGAPPAPGEFNWLCDVHVALTGDVFASDAALGLVHIFSPRGSYLGSFELTKKEYEPFFSPHDVSVAADGTVYVADAGNHRVEYFRPVTANDD